LPDLKADRIDRDQSAKVLADGIETQQGRGHLRFLDIQAPTTPCGSAMTITIISKPKMISR